MVRIVIQSGPGHREAAQAVVAAALGRAPDELDLEKDGRGKPQVRAPATDLRFSVAHTLGLTLVAVGLGVDVGVDVERLDRRVTGWALWAQTLTTDEASRLPLDRAARNATLLRHWVRREALLKAAGVGLAVEPRALELAADGRICALPAALGAPGDWALEDVPVPGCAAAVACRPGAAIAMLEVEGPDGVVSMIRTARGPGERSARRGPARPRTGRSGATVG